MGCLVLYKFEVKVKQMKIKLLIVPAAVFCLAACTKDKFDTKPQLEFKSVNTTVLNQNQLLEFTLHYTDREGDIANTRFFIQKVTQNCEGSNFTDSSNYTPEVPVQSNGEGDVLIQYFYGSSFDYPILNGPQCATNDTCVFRFVLKDAQNNISDTVTSPTIVIIKS